MMIPEKTPPRATGVPTFTEQVLAACPHASTPGRTSTLMLNVGLRCMAACAHCHHSCSPQRTEVMSRTTMLQAIELVERIRPDLVDITGGEPESFAALPELVTRLREADIPMRVRTNLVALSRRENDSLPELFAACGVRILGSLPGTSAAAIEAQRGSAWWETALSMLHRLNALGYGRGGDGTTQLVLDLAYNPALGELCKPQNTLEVEFRRALGLLGVRFDSLLAIANVPVGRMATFLRDEGSYAEHVALLASEFNPCVVEAIQCRHGFEIAWDGSLWDCDFNLAARVRPAAGPLRLEDLLGAGDPGAMLANRRIGFGPHCFACTAASGSG